MTTLPKDSSAAALIVEEANKLTLGQRLEVFTSYQVQGVLEMKGHLWLTRGRLTKYQALLLDIPEVILKPCNTLNATSLMPTETSPVLTRSCLDVIGQVYSSRINLLDIPLDNQEEWFAEGSSFIQNGQRKAGYPVVSL